ncbi:MAG: CbtA family protein [Rhodobacteraceae bacterium]|nr:CbtA family protein [Paracoccaceae bacterium]
MTRQIFASALFAGLAAGVLAALLQFAFVVPLLLEGELFETGARVHFAGADGVPQSVAGGVGLSAELGRHLGTLAMNLIAYTGFALVLVAGFALAQRAGHRVTPRSGLVWGLAGFVAVQLAPAAGLPPELPGTTATDLGLRQGWWALCVATTAAGLGLIAFGRGALALAGAVVLILLPHVVGAPHLDTYFGIAPPELSALFATRSLAVAAASWVVLGLVAATFWSRETP